ncbi:vesicle transport v-SNARE domain-containing protein, putative [Eimeria mitis]|uniref:Vesicle transport v-SNARE domain-containing protein, putative n=1 Tax=Eimeria mitis TaxID=44415 RepID=U6JS41_9EIME|nr:vesicle transport v-SNARE domain-containing protein, putative [Eimeria mitis]CDJ26862.1 vesicle transport v-SNARE domain-containing protein, putative [Eimeria mitis]
MDYRRDGLGGVEVEEQLLQFEQAIDDLREAVRQLASNPLTNSQDRQKHIIQINKLKQEATVCMRSLALELRCSSSVLSPEAISRLVRRQQLLQQQFKEVAAECEEQLLSVSKDELLQRYDRAHEQPQEEATEACPQQQRQQLITLGDEIQDQTELSLARTQQQAAETEEMGGAILQRLQQQNEQLDSVKDGLENVECTEQVAQLQQPGGHCSSAVQKTWEARTEEHFMNSQLFSVGESVGPSSWARDTTLG